MDYWFLDQRSSALKDQTKPASEPTGERPDKLNPATPPMWLLSLCVANAVIGLTILTPVVPLIRSTMEISSSAVQQLLTSYLVAFAVGQLIWGSLSDRIGRRTVMLTGSACFTLSGILILVVDNITGLVVLRFIQGFGAAAFNVNGTSNGQ